jgi:hypothetical protein
MSKEYPPVRGAEEEVAPTAVDEEERESYIVLTRESASVILRHLRKQCECYAPGIECGNCQAAKPLNEALSL